MVYRRRRRGFFERRSFTSLLIMINVVAFFFFLLFMSLNSNLIDSIALNPENVVTGKSSWTIFTSMFMHAGIFHLFVNMISLFFLGSLVERVIGRKRFLWFYLLAGLLGSLFFVGFAYLGQSVPRGDFLFGSIGDYAVGASGAIFGLLGILAVLLPRKEIYLIMGQIIVIVLQFAITPFVSESLGGTINLFSTMLIFLMIFAMFSPNPNFRKLAMSLKLQFWITPIVAIVPLVFVGFFVKLPIGNTAHFGGLVAGLIYGFYLRKKYSRKIKTLNKMFR